MNAEELKKYELAIMNVRANLVQGKLGTNPMWKKAADAYTHLFDYHKKLQAFAQEVQRIQGEQQGIGAAINKMAGAMEVMEQVLAEELLNSGAALEDVDMQKLQRIAQEQAGIAQPTPAPGQTHEAAVGLALAESEIKE